MLTSFLMQSMHQSAERWVEELFLRSQALLEGDKERRFMFPLVGPAQDGCEETPKSCWPTQLRISFAMMEAYALFQQALHLYGSDFERLFQRTLEITGKNAVLSSRSSFAIDPSSLHSLAEMNSLMTDLFTGATKESLSYWSDKTAEILPALASGNLEEVACFWERQARVFKIVVHQNPAAMDAIRAHMGFQFDDTRRFTQIAETSRAVLYQVLPMKDGVKVRMNGKPNMHMSPFILPENIIDLLPSENLSLVGAFANGGTPTYFVHIKDILTTPAVQLLTEEDLLLDLRLFGHMLHMRHGKKVTLVGTCQGALPTLHAVCSPELGIEADVDAWVGIVPAYALASSPRVKGQMDKIPPSKRNLENITERLANGNVVVAGEPSALSMRLGNFCQENPLSRLIGDIRSAEKGELPPMALALRAYLGGVRPMPLRMTEMSQRCATKRITKGGVFPGQLFGKTLSLQHAIDCGIRLHVVAGSKDTVVDPDAALAMFQIECIRKYAGATHHVIEGAGHVAPMTTCTRESAKNFIGNTGGPLWFHIKLEQEAAQ